MLTQINADREKTENNHFTLTLEMQSQTSPLFFYSGKIVTRKNKYSVIKRLYFEPHLVNLGFRISCRDIGSFKEHVLGQFIFGNSAFGHVNKVSTDKEIKKKSHL